MAEKRALDEENTKKDKRIHEMSSRLKHSDENARKQVDQVTRNYCFGLVSLRFRKWLKDLNQSEVKPKPILTDFARVFPRLAPATCL